MYKFLQPDHLAPTQKNHSSCILHLTKISPYILNSFSTKDFLFMSYKHNNLMAMRENYWNDTDSALVQEEKKFFQYTLLEQEIHNNPSEDDAKYLFFSLPSIIIVKGYALGFRHDTVQAMILKYIQNHKSLLQQKGDIKIQFRM